MKTICCALLICAAVLFGCKRERSVMTYAEAKVVFVQGMSPAELEKAYGKPTYISDYPEGTRWNYVPVKEIERGGKASYSGFVVILVNGKATAIWERETVAH